MSRRILVIAPHADDEVLGVGGTIARFAGRGDAVHVVIATKGYPPAFSPESGHQIEAEALAAHQLLGVADTVFLGFPAAALDTVEHRDINARLTEVVTRVRPHVIFAPFGGDLHLDHQRVFLSSLVALRPGGRICSQAIYAYETVSETHWSVPYLMPNFAPNVFVDITPQLDTKIAAMEAFASQIKPFPHARSAGALRALAALRGSTVGCAAAESFVLIRQEF